MKTTKKILTIEILSAITVTLITIFLFESDILFNGKGIYAGLKFQEFIIATIMELFVIFIIPLSLKMTKIKCIRKYLTEDAHLSAKRLLCLGSLRIIALCLPMYINTLLYYFFMQTTFGYIGIILMLCLFFIYPTTERCENETTAQQN
jgi:hypothetical protein